MSTMRFPAVIFSASLLLSALGSSPAHAEDDTAKVCSTAYEGAQEARKKAELISARDRLLVCSQDQCPKFIRQDCVGWLEEVRRSIPSFVIVAKDAHGNDVMDFKATLDGKPLEGSLSLAIDVDPGKHRLVLEAAGSEPIEHDIVLREGEHRRMVEVTFQPLAAAPEPAAPAVAEIPEDTSPGGSVVPYVLGGVGVLGLAGFAYFGLSGKDQRSDLESSCKPNCSQDQIDEVDQKFLFADISLGIGVVSLGVAAYLLLSEGTSAAPGDSARRATRSSAWTITAAPGGAFAGYRGRF